MDQENANVRHENLSSSIQLTYVGTATVLLEIAGLRILTDPVLDPAGSRYRVGRTALLTHTNLAGPAVAAESLPPIDLALVSHDHHKDNLDRTGRELLRKVPRVLTTGVGARRLGQRFAIAATGLAPWQSAEAETPGGEILRITATPAQHGPRLMKPLVGDVIGFALEHPAFAGRALWISGDTVFFPGLREIARRFDVGVALVHVGAARFGFTGPIRYTFDAAELVATLDLLDPAIAVPIHYEGWSHFSQGRAEIEEAIAAAGLHGTELGRRVRFIPLGESRDFEVSSPGAAS